MEPTGRQYDIYRSTIDSHMLCYKCHIAIANGFIIIILWSRVAVRYSYIGIINFVA